MPAEYSETSNVARFNKHGALERLLWEAVDATVKGQPSCVSVASPKYEDGKNRCLGRFAAFGQPVPQWIKKELGTSP